MCNIQIPANDHFEMSEKMKIEEFLRCMWTFIMHQISHSDIVTVLFQFVTSKEANQVLSDAENLTEERVDRVLKEFLKDLKEGVSETKGWDSYLSAYTLSKAALNAHTRILAKKYPRLMINSVCPGYVKTDINCFTGILTTQEGAQSPVRLALLPTGGVSGMFFSRTDMIPF